MVRSSSRILAAAAAAVLGSVVLAAQSTPPPGAPGQAPPQKPVTAEQQPTFRARADLVTSDVIVRDGSGQFISDLKKDEFEIYEDEVKQNIVSMVLVHGGRTFNVTLPPPAPTAEGIILPAKRPTNDAAGRIFIVFVDDLHLDFRNTGRIRELFKKIGKTLIHEGDMFGIVSTGPSSISIDLTYDLKRFDEAVKKIAGNGLKPQDILDAPQGAEGNSEIRYRAHTAFSTAYDILKKLEAVHNRRKAFIYVSEGYDFNPFEQSRLKYGAFSQNAAGGSADNPDDPNYTDPFTRQGTQFAEADLVRELAELTRAANRANATFYTIDPRGLVGGPDLDEKVDPTEWNDYVRVSQDSLRVIAEQTGGIAVVNQNDFDKALKRIDAETSDYYVLGFYSSNPDPLKRTRKIEVKVKRPDLNVWSRPQYSLRPNPAVKGSK
jgi:VWFA-related protein